MSANAHNLDPPQLILTSPIHLLISRISREITLTLNLH